jgi:hypothetical protein
MASARQADGSLPVLPFLRPSATSQLIGKGVDLGFPFSGTAPDLGCFDHKLGLVVVYDAGVEDASTGGSDGGSDGGPDAGGGKDASGGDTGSGAVGDSAAPDASTDGSIGSHPDGSSSKSEPGSEASGCSCRVMPGRDRDGSIVLVLGLLVAGRRRRASRGRGAS